MRVFTLSRAPAQVRCESSSREEGDDMGSPELRARVEAILADRAARRRRLLEWQQATRPNKTTSDAEWKAFLEPLEYEVLRQKGTEPRGGEYDGIYPAEGYFSCRGCGLPLYRAAAKFKS